MRGILILCFVSLSTTCATPAVADCASEIQSLFQDGAWDPFARENRRETTVVRRADGVEEPYTDVLWDGPVRSINCTANGCFMAIGSASWQGPSFDGPWTPGNDTGVSDPEEFARATNQRLAASVQEEECLGETQLDGRNAHHYRFMSKPEPNEYGSWWGGRYSVWVDSTANQILRIELAEGIASWAPAPSNDVQITTIVYDESIRIEEPK